MPIIPEQFADLEALLTYFNEPLAFSLKAVFETYKESLADDHNLDLN